MKKIITLTIATIALSACGIYDARDERAPRTTAPTTAAVQP